MNVSKISVKTGLTQKDLRISDGRGYFWQWDTGCQLTVIGCPEISELHYFRKGLNEPMTLKVIDKDGKIVCDVPDELLQESVEFIVYAYLIDEEGNITKFSKNFLVKARPKPVDYVYTPTEVQTVESIAKKVLDDAIANGEIGGENDITVEIKDGVLNLSKKEV